MLWMFLSGDDDDVKNLSVTQAVCQRSVRKSPRRDHLSRLSIAC